MRVWERVQVVSRSERSPLIVHLAIIAIGLIVLVVLATRQWLFSDDWAFVVERPNTLASLLEPHVGHWVVIPYLLFLGIRQIFGLDHYLPFAVPVILAHLGLAHLTWRIMLRVGVLPWIATSLTLLTVFFGVGVENVVWAFQVSFVGPMTAMFGVILLLLSDKLRARSVVAIAVLSTIAVASSGTALPLILVAVLVAVTRHGVRTTVIAFAAPVLIYGVWFLAIGRNAPPAGRAVGGQILLVPQYALRMLSDGLGVMFPIPLIGVVVFLTALVWWTFGIAFADRRSRPAFLLFVAAPVFALLTGYSRIGLGQEFATGSRYLYFVIFAMLPFLALGLSRLVVRFRLPLVPALALLVIVGLSNAGSLVVQLHQRELAANDTRSRLSAAAGLIAESPSSYAADQRPYLKWSLDVTVADLENFERQGWFHPTPYSESAKWSEVAALDVRATATTAPAATTKCTTLAPGANATEDAVAGVLVRVSKASTVNVALGSGDTVAVKLTSGWNQLRLDRTFDGVPALRITANASAARVCALP